MQSSEPAVTPITRVLLAEDDPDVRELVAGALRAGGCQVTEADDGLELYNRLGEFLFEGAAKPDLIVSDNRMPNWSGLEVLGSVHRAELDIPFILMTAYSDRAVRDEARRLGAAAVLAKPFSVEALLDAVRACTQGEPCDASAG